MILSNKILQFHAWFSVLRPFLIENEKRYKFNEEMLLKLEKHWKEWNKVYLLYISKTTHTDANIKAINTNHLTCFRFLATIRKNIKFIFDLELTEKENLFLKMNKNTKVSGKTAVTGYAPCICILKNQSRQVTFFAFDPLRIHTKQNPPGAERIGYKLAYTEIDALEPSGDEYKKAGNQKKSMIELSIPSDKTKMRLYIIVYYISPSGEEGIDSFPIMIKLL